MIKKILIANRGEIACRIIRTAKSMGVATVAVYSKADRDALHVKMADEAVFIGPSPSPQSYLVIDNIIAAIRQTGADAVHPGYGFLSENAEFAQRLASEGVIFIGPPVGAIEAMGDKIASKKLAQSAGVSTVPGHMGLIIDADEAIKIARQIGFPVMIKASAGGGGKGMRVAHNDEEVRQGYQASKNEAMNAFGDDRIFIEKFITEPRHIEIQVLGDQFGNCLYLGERECSIQRRNQKIIEEAPSSFLDAATRKAMGEQAVALMRAVAYHSVGTVEFIVDGNRNFYFLEMNTRLQVEHPVTELVTGLDLVEEMILVASGQKLRWSQGRIKLNGWAMESRLYAEDPYRNFLPSIGRLTRYRPPQDGRQKDGTVIRNDTGVTEGSEISMFYDPMIAKLCTWAPTRLEAIAAMSQALDNFEIEGIGHNLPFLAGVINHPRFHSGNITTAFIAEEWPDGFTGVLPDSGQAGILIAIAAFAHLSEEVHKAMISGTLSHRHPKPENTWIANVDGQPWPLDITIADGSALVTLAQNISHNIRSDWKPGATHAIFTVDGSDFGVKINRTKSGWRLRWRGVDLKVILRSPRVTDLARWMPVPKPDDNSRMLLCPMPGVITSILVAVGDQVEAGQALATVEAMKMENVLRANRRSIILSIAVESGQSLAVDALIMEFRIMEFGITEFGQGERDV